MLARLRKPNNKGYVAIVPQADGCALVHLERDGERDRLVEQVFLPRVDGSPLQQQLAETLRRQRFGQLPCTTLMGVDEYQLLLVDAPQVPPAELRAAIRWKVRELIDFHVDDAMVDVFDAPASSARGVQDHLYTVVSRSSAVRARVDLLQEAGARLEVIDIPELALRNIVDRLPENPAGVALLYFGPQRGLITLVRNSTLYLARSLDIGYRDLEAASADPRPLWDTLALELQRSMDYYDRHFQQAQIGHVLLAPLPVPVPGMVEGLHDSLGLPVREVALDEVVSLAEPLDPAAAAHCFLAVGAALRRETKSL
jgi:MSHA biogenesis protein MshI